MLQKGYRINHTLTHNKKSYMIDVFCDEIYECIVYERLIGSLDNSEYIKELISYSCS